MVTCRLKNIVDPHKLAEFEECVHFRYRTDSAVRVMFPALRVGF
jgi:hypothetical protein